MAPIPERGPAESLLTTPAALAKRVFETSKIRILDATWFMPTLGNARPRDPEDEFQRGPRIKGAAGFWNVDQIAAHNELGLRHMLPTPERFAEACSEMGIHRDSEVVFYDTHGLFSSPRAAFTFKAFGHPNVKVLNGGLPRWIAEDLPTDRRTFGVGYPFPKSSYPIIPLIEANVKSYDEIVAHTEAGPDAKEVVFDARPAARFTGAQPEPRAGLSSGHMPNSVSLPFSNLRKKNEKGNYDDLLTDQEEITQILLKALGNDKTKLEQVLSGKLQVINSCGSGMTAAVIWLALQELGIHSSIYDESWTGYASRPESKILKGR